MTLVTIYTGSYRTWDDVVSKVRANAGTVFVMVVQERRRNSDDLDYTYGFFYRALDGSLSDVQKKSRPGLKTLHRADNVLDELDAIYEGRVDRFDLPVKAERNLVKPGMITAENIPTYAYLFDDTSQSKT